MTDLSNFPITRRWPAAYPDRIQLYSLPTPNGIKVAAALEETGLPYEAHRVDFSTNDQKSAEFLSLNPNGKIPAIIDPNGPGGRPIGLFESGAILLYLADKTGKLLSSDPGTRWETIAWLFFQMGGVGPMFGQFGYFNNFAGKEIEDRRPRQRYLDETRRLLSVLDGRLAGRDFIAGDAYSIADIATWPWVRALDTAYQGTEILGLDEFGHVGAWLDRCMERPASKRGLSIPAKPQA
ncbi:MAG: glutathione S-transferase C-terminal domain-containing protein [Rhizobiaceae bacterium]